MSDSLISVKTAKRWRDDVAQELELYTRTLRARTRIAYANGVPVDEIAAAAGVSRRTIYKWLDRV